MRPDESLGIITQMMAQTRRSVLGGAYLPLLVWGWVTVAVGMAVYFSVVLTADPRHYLLWFLIPPLGLAGMRLFRRGRHVAVRTALTAPLHSIWWMLTAVLLSFSVTSYFVSFNVLFFVLLLLAIGCYVTGALVKYPFLQYSSVAGFVLAASMWLVTDERRILLFVAAIFAMMIIPAYKMKKDLKAERA